QQEEYRGRCHRRSRVVSRALQRLLGAPASYFDVVAAGTLTTALSKDVDVLDRAIPDSLKLLLQTVLQLTSIVIFNAALSPVFLLVLPLTVSLRFLAVSKEVRKIENKSIGGLASVLKEVFQGGAAIRCDASIVDALRTEFCDALDVGNRARDVAEQLDRWSGMRLEFVSSILASAAAFMSVVYSANIPPAFAGVAVVNCLTTSRILLMLCRRIGMFQMQFMSVEEILRLQDVPQETQGALAISHLSGNDLFAGNSSSVGSSAIQPGRSEIHQREDSSVRSNRSNNSSSFDRLPHQHEVSHLSLAYRSPPAPPSTELVYSLTDVNIWKGVIQPS
ncbi:ABC transporter, putative, partial [Bodo saltans]